MPTVTNQKPSSCVQQIDFDHDSGDLTVTLNGGRQYVYPNRTTEEHNAFVAAQSHGQHFNSVVRRWPHRE
jgi:frataxin-like iron-binding protein CyaY